MLGFVLCCCGGARTASKSKQRKNQNNAKINFCEGLFCGTAMPNIKTVKTRYFYIIPVVQS
jgi:hypothetical protein